MTSLGGAPGSQRAIGSSMLQAPHWCSQSTSGTVTITLVSDAAVSAVTLVLILALVAYVSVARNGIQAISREPVT